MKIYENHYISASNTDEQDTLSFMSVSLDNLKCSETKRSFMSEKEKHKSIF